MSDAVLIPTVLIVIFHLQVHIMAASGFPTAVARPTQNCTLLVETSMPVTGTLTVEVDSSEPSNDFN